MNAATFVLSTGRCGTQWLARFLEMNLGERATVTHEPIHDGWAPRKVLGTGRPSGVDPHLRFIRDTLEHRAYIECGYPLWSSVPFLLETFGPDVRIIHLIRHPVPVAWSWLTHRAYCKPLLPHLPEKILLSPFDDGVQFPEYRERWASMWPLEKALYYWLEVNAFAKRVRSSAGRWMTVPFEELFKPPAQEAILSFVDGVVPGEVRSPGHVDELRGIVEFEVDPAVIAKHPAVVELAAEFGFDALDFDVQSLSRRYMT